MSLLSAYVYLSLNLLFGSALTLAFSRGRRKEGGGLTLLLLHTVLINFKDMSGISFSIDLQLVKNIEGRAALPGQGTIEYRENETESKAEETNHGFYWESSYQGGYSISASLLDEPLHRRVPWPN